VVAVLTFVPHFDLPFRFQADGHPAVAEQDTLEDITNCVLAILLTKVGQREDLPDFGVEDLAFDLQPLPLHNLVNDIVAQEPRASVFFDQHPDLYDQMIARVTANVAAAQGVGNA
jgi:hypothetical protein